MQYFFFFNFELQYVNEQRFIGLSMIGAQRFFRLFF